MQLTQGQALGSKSRTPLPWRIAGRYLPAAAIALASVLLLRNLVVDDGLKPSSTPVASNHAAVQAASVAFWEGRVEANPGDTISLNKLTGLYLQRARETGDVADVRRATHSAERSAAALPNDYTGRVNLAQVRLAQHDFAAAAAAARSAIALIPTRADGHALLGDAQLALGEYTAAADSYRLFLEKAPGFAAFSRSATLAEIQGNVPLAQQFWLAAIDADAFDAPENSAWARVQLGQLYFNTGKLDAAERQFGEALEVFPGYSHANAGLGRVAAARVDEQRAIDFYTQATSAVPVLEYVIALGEVQLASGEAQAAARSFDLVRAISTLYQANGVRFDLALVLFEADHGDPASAVEAARAAYAARPSLAAADAVAWALYRTGQYDEAATFAAEALRLGTRDPLYLFHAGMIAAARDDRAAARGFLESALELNPQFHPLHATTARQTLARVDRGGRP